MSEKELVLEVAVAGDGQGAQRVAVSPGPKRMLVKPNEGADRTAGGIIIPDIARKDATTTGTVVAVPEPYLIDGEEMAPAYPVGTQVIFGKFTGQEIEVPRSSDPSDRRTDKLIVMWEKDVVAVVRHADADEVPGADPQWYITEGAVSAIAAHARQL